jgi:hypothetical protein
VTIKVQENKEAKGAAVNHPRDTPNVTTKANLSSVAQPNPVTGPSIVEKVTVPPETGLLHLLADMVVQEKERRGADKEPIIQASPPAAADPQVVDKPSNLAADCLKRADQGEALSRCNFLDHDSINEHYPAYVGKGTFNCPLLMINAATTKSGKARIILDWRMLTPKQQKEKLDAIYDNQLVLQERLASNASSVENMVQLSSCKNRRTLAKDSDMLGEFSGNEDEWVKVFRAHKRQLERNEWQNAKNR